MAKHLRADFLPWNKHLINSVWPLCGNTDMTAWVEPDYRNVTCDQCLQHLIGVMDIKYVFDTDKMFFTDEGSIAKQAQPTKASDNLRSE
jgi:hypothetical protein